MLISSTLPTVFAKNLAHNVGLFIYDKDSHGQEDEWLSWRDRLITFQQMACSCTLETCMIVYNDEILDENQISVLKFIHETTKPWLMGHLAGTLIEKLNNPLITGKDAADLAKIIKETFGAGDSGDGESSKKKSWLVRFANIPEGTEISVKDTVDAEDDEQAED